MVEKMTNYERIKQMTVDEMANFFYHRFDCGACPADEVRCFTSCEMFIKEWLLSEVEDDR